MQTRWSPLTKIIVIICGLGLLVYVLFRFSQVIPPLIIAAILAYILNLPVSWVIRQTGWPRIPVVIMVFLTVLFLLILVPFMFWPRLVQQAQEFRQVLEGLLRQLDATLQQLVSEPFVIPLLDYHVQTPEIEQFVREITQGLQAAIGPLTTSLFAVFVSVASTVGWLVFILVVVFWLLKDWPVFARFVAERLPPDYADEYRRLWSELQGIWDAFFRGYLILGFIMGAIAYVILRILGIPSALPLAVTVGVLEFIPTIGPIISSIPAVLIAFFQGSTHLELSGFWLAGLVLLLYFAMNQFESLYLAPRIIGHHVKLHPLVIWIGAIGGAVYAGLLGMLLAAPIIASARIIIGYCYRKVLELDPFELPVVPIRDPALQWRGLISGRSVDALLFDLDGTLFETDKALVKQLAHRLRWFAFLFPNRDPGVLIRWLMANCEGIVNRLIVLLYWMRLHRRFPRFLEVLRVIRGYRSIDELETVDGSLEMLSSLKGRYRLGLVTTRSRTETDALLSHFQLQDAFHAVITRDDTRYLKPHPQPVHEAAAALGVPVENCVLVGDTGVDVRAARAAGALSIGVLSGFGRKQDLSEADLILDSTAQLTEWV